MDNLVDHEDVHLVKRSHLEVLHVRKVQFRLAVLVQFQHVVQGHGGDIGVGLLDVRRRDASIARMLRVRKGNKITKHLHPYVFKRSPVGAPARTFIFFTRHHKYTEVSLSKTNVVAAVLTSMFCVSCEPTK